MPSSLKRFWSTYLQTLRLAYRVSPRMLIGVTLINIFWGLSNLPVLYIGKLLIDVVVKSFTQHDYSSSLRTILLLVGIRTLIEIVRSTLSRLNNVYSNSLISRVNGRVEVLIGEKLNSLDVSQVESPQFQNRLKKIQNQANQRVWGMIGPLSEIPNSLFTILSGLIPLLSFNSIIWAIAIGVRIPEIIINAKLAKRDYLAIEKKSYLYKLWGWINFHLTFGQYFYENKILGNTQFLSGKMTRVQQEIFDADYDRRMYRAKFRSFADVPNYLFSFALNSYFFLLAIVGKISLGTAQMLYQSASTLGGGFSQLLDNISNIYENYLFVDDLTELLNMPEENVQGILKPSKTFKSGIEFKDVWFKYPTSKDWTLKGVNFEINLWENIALVGENGAGKTTLIKLLCGFYKPDKGEILVNGKSIHDYNLRSYRDLIGVLFQEFNQYPFTARESIGYGDVSRIESLTEIQTAAGQTDVHDFISDLPLGYENPLTKEFDRGTEPSKGQWQRIALARTLFRNSRIVILDEPTSNVDPKAEEEIFDKIITLSKQKILILISHRFSTVRRADKILLLEDGKITEEGTHLDLMKHKGKYAKLFNLQAKSYQ